VLKPSDLAERSDFRQGPLNISPGRRLVEGPAGKLHVEPLVMRVFLTLLDAGGAVVTRETLFDQCWGGVVIGDDSLNRSITMVRRMASSACPGIFEIENIPRTGYRLSGDLLSFQPEVATERLGHKDWAEQEPGMAVQARSRSKNFSLGAAALLITAILGALLYFEVFRGSNQADPASIAVLPFRNMSDGDPYFAEGIGEEILGALAREPQFRVVGHASSSELGDDLDAREAGRRLNVDYVLEGSVRTQGDRVRVNANLTRASDGIRLWSDSYDGNLDDIFVIQQSIGGSIAGALRRKLFRRPTLSGPLVTNGETYNLYLTARGLIRTRNRRVIATASSLLRDAINLDPGYAPAWASLAESTFFEDHPTDPHEGLIIGITRGQRYARHSLRLAPDLAEGHRILGMLLGYGSPEAQVHLRRAAELDPNSAENLIELGSAHGAAGEFAEELTVYERAGQLDPLWYRSVGAAGIALADRGLRAEADAAARRGFAKNPINQHVLLGRIAAIFGDYSEAIRHWSIVARANSPRWSFRVQEDLSDAKTVLGLSNAKLQVAVRRRWRIATRPERATPAVWQAHNRSAIAADVYRDINHLTAKLMLNEGRASELVATYAGPTGLFSIRPNQPLRVDQLHEVPVVALALRQAGREAEAIRLLREAETATRAVYRRSRVPFWFDADAATMWAAQGRTDEALSALERALSRGWTHTAATDLSDIADEPAFRSLQANPRFERIKAKLEAHFARERRETMQLRV